MAKAKKAGAEGPAPKRQLTGWGPRTNGPRPARGSELLDSQVVLLGDLLRAQQGTLAGKCAVLFALDVTPDDVAAVVTRLRGTGGTFQCEDCGRWLPVAEVKWYPPEATPADWLCQTCDKKEGDDDGEG